ncbi:MAG: hypothetical protein ACR2KJ_05620 [Jatrophihabitans sp.]
MTGRQALDRFLTTDPADAGCDGTAALLDAYLELVVAGADPDQQYPGIAAHLRSCLPCAEDFDGLLLAVTGADPS